MKNGYVLDNGKLGHIKVAEEVLKRKLNKNEVIHHIDHNRQNNNPSNLALFESQKSHKHFENKQTQFGNTRYVIEELNKRTISNLKWKI